MKNHQLQIAHTAYQVIANAGAYPSLTAKNQVAIENKTLEFQKAQQKMGISFCEEGKYYLYDKDHKPVLGLPVTKLKGMLDTEFEKLLNENPKGYVISDKDELTDEQKAEGYYFGNIHPDRLDEYAEACAELINSDIEISLDLITPNSLKKYDDGDRNFRETPTIPFVDSYGKPREMDITLAIKVLYELDLIK